MTGTPHNLLVHRAVHLIQNGGLHIHEVWASSKGSEYYVIFYEVGIDLVPERKEILKDFGVREFVLNIINVSVVQY